MALNLIKGPLNSGRTGLIRGLVLDCASADPLIVAPTPAARRELERELCEAGGGALVGPSVTSPDGLAKAVLRAAGQAQPHPASPAQILALTQRAIDARQPRILARSARSPGFAAALARLFGDLRAARADASQAAASDAYLGEILAIYAAFTEALAGSGVTDRPGLLIAARRALEANQASWGSRPVFLYSFDDMTRVQLDLVEALAELAPVTVSLTHEDRRSLAARARLFNELAPRASGRVTHTEPDPAFTPSPLLFHFERHFGEDDAPAHLSDGSLRLLRSAGVRGECELIAEQVKLLLASGTEPARVAIATRDPDRQGPPLARALKDAGVPVALEASIPLARTAFGAALLSISDATHGDGEAAALVRYLRGPGSGERRDSVDRLEAELLRRGLTTLPEALGAWQRFAARPLGEVEEMVSAGDDGPAFLGALESVAAAVAERMLDSGGTSLAALGAEPELNAAQAVSAAIRELRQLGSGAGPSYYLRVLRQLSVPATGGPAGNRVRIASPYSLYTVRSRRFDHLFVAGLQDREFPRPESEGPFLSAEQRLALGMPERADTDAEELYLFQICLALPTHGLWLSSRVATEDGLDAQPSPFVSLIEGLLDRSSAGAVRDIVIERDIASVVSAAETAPSEHQLLRSLASERGTEVEGSLGRNLRARIDRAADDANRAAATRPLRSPATLKDLAAKTEFGASELEIFSIDPGRWFIDYGLRPVRLGPDPEPLVLGGLSHRILERLYATRPGGRSKPDAESMAEWQEALAAIASEAAAQFGLTMASPGDRIGVHQVRRNLALFLASQARIAATAMEPRCFEASFGSRDGQDRPALELGDWRLIGKIDRIDLTPEGGQALIHDYKFARQVHPVARFEPRGLLQLPLYLLAVRELWKAEPAGALYHPLRKPRERPRGLLRKDEDATAALRGLGRYDNDCLAPDAFEAELRAAAERAGRAVAGIRAGAIDWPPLPDAHSPGPAQASIHRRFGDRFADPGEEPR